MNNVISNRTALLGGVEPALCHIVFCIAEVCLHLLWGDLFDDLCRHSHHHRAIRHHHAFRHQCPCSDDAVFAHDTVVQQGGVHPDEAAIPYGAAVDKGAVPHRYIFAQSHFSAPVAVEHGVVLHIGIFADGQHPVIPPQYGTVPHRGTGLQHHISLHRGICRHKDGSFVPGSFSTKGQHHC